MKKLILLIPILAIASNPIPAPVPVHPPEHTAVPTPQIGIIGGAVIVGIGAGVAIWGGMKAIDAVLDIWEKRVTNGIPEVKIFRGSDGQVFLLSPPGTLEHAPSVYGPWQPIVFLREESFVLDVPEGFYRTVTTSYQP